MKESEDMGAEERQNRLVDQITSPTHPTKTFSQNVLLFHCLSGFTLFLQDEAEV